MIDVVTMSSKGQFVIPKELREEMGLEMQDKFIIIHDKENILLKRISEEEANKAMLRLMDRISGKFRKAGITREDVSEEIKAARAKK